MSKDKGKEKIDENVQDAAIAIGKELEQVTVERVVVTQADVEEYIKATRGFDKDGKPTASMSLNEYLTKKQNKSHTHIIADLSKLEFNENNYKTAGRKNELLKPGYLVDLRGADFSGSIIKDAKFIGCDLSGAAFRDTDLNGAYFEKTNLNSVDFRGADLAATKFSEGYRGLSGAGKNYVSDIKYSTTPSLVRRYADVKAEGLKKTDQELAEEKKQQEKFEQDKLIRIEGKEKEQGEIEGSLGWGEAFVYTIGGGKKAAKYKEIQKEIEAIRAETFTPKPDHIMDPSLRYVFGSDGKGFDPTYVRGSSKEERDQPKVLVRLTREQVFEYAEKESQIPLNEFAAKIAKEQGIVIPSGAKVIADLSSKVNLKNEWDRLDLRGVNFKGADLRGVNFSGSDLRGAVFTGANISNASFESAEVGASIFNNTTARDANFFNADLSNCRIKDSDFKRAFMPRSIGEKANIKESDFSYADIRKGKWDEAKLGDVKLNFANLEGISLANADLQRVSAQHAILNNAILTNANIIESDFQHACLEHAKATKSKWLHTSLIEIDASAIDLTDAEIDKFSKLDGADLESAILERVKADGVSFKKANLDKARVEFASFVEADLSGATARFADFNHAILREAKAQNVDMTGSNLTNVDARSANFKEAILRDIQAPSANFEKALLEAADARGANLTAAILEKVNARKANLEHANLNKANLQDANVDEAKVSADTQMDKDTNLDNVQGKLIKVEEDGKEVKIEPEKHKEDQILAEKANRAGWIGRGAAGALRGVGRGALATAKFIGQPFSTKTGIIIGVAVGVIIAAGIAAAVVASGGTLLIPLGGIGLVAGVGGGIVLGGAVIGALSGGIIARKGGICAVASLVGGTIMGGPIGTVIGGVGYFGANSIVKKFTGKSIDTNLANGAEVVGNAANSVGNNIASEEGIRLHEERVSAQNKYKPAERDVSEGPSPSASLAAQKNRVIAQRDKEQDSPSASKNQGLDTQKSADKESKKEKLANKVHKVKVKISHVKDTAARHAKGLAKHVNKNFPHPPSILNKKPGGPQIGKDN